MLIRHAQITDAPALARIEKASYPAAEGASLESISRRIEVFPECFWILEDNGQILAFINGMATDQPELTDEMYDQPRLHRPEGRWQMLFSVVTAPEHRHKGYASLVMHQVIRDCRSRREGIVLTCKEGLIPFYAGFGFESEGLSRSVHGDAVWYQMRLSLHRIETERLILRPFREEDYDDLFEFLSQLEDNEFESYPGITYENGKEHLNYRLASEEFYAIELKDSGKVIGNIYCGNRDFEARELGYIVNKNYQRQGYAREALDGVIRFLFQSGIHRVYAECDPRNDCSWRLLEKAGLRREAHFRKNVFFHRDENGQPKWKDTYVYALLNEDRPR